MAWYSLIYYAALEGVFHKPLPTFHPVCVCWVHTVCDVERPRLSHCSANSRACIPDE